MAGPARPPAQARRPLQPGRVVRWLLLAAVGWIALSIVVFLVSAQIQQGKVSDANRLLGGAGYPLWSPTNVLVLGSDVRNSANAEPGAQTTGNGRSDSIMLMRIGGGANSRLSIARDTIVDIPGAGRQKINAAFAIGGAALAVQTVEQYTGVDINHVIDVSFENFPQLIDAMGGITTAAAASCRGSTAAMPAAATRCACAPARRTSTASRRWRSRGPARTAARRTRTT